MRVNLIIRQTLASSGRCARLEGRPFSSSACVATNPSSAKKKPDVRDSLIKPIAQEHRLPRFAVPSEKVRLFEQPSDFYKELLGIISRARRRIFIASLYIGKTETELISQLRRALERSPELEITILVDSLRSTREGLYRGTPRTSSCASLLARLQVDYPERVQVRLYRAPDLPIWLEKLVGKRFVEGWGLQHMKIYGADDEVMTSGANLSNDYFTNRRDRYIRIQDKEISQYMYSLLMVAARYSFSLKGQPTRVQGKEEDSQDHAPYELSWDEGKSLPLQVDSQENHGPLRWKSAMSKEINQLTKRWLKSQNSAMNQIEQKKVATSMVEFVPLLQMGPLDIKQETICIPKVMELANSRAARLDFTTGYFSINPQYAELILSGRFKIDITTASPKANGFYNSKGISKHLPAAYTWLETLFWRRTRGARRANDIVMREWYKPGWTYHAKGIWLYPVDSVTPTVTLLGSSNFGTRSADLDLECTMLIDATNSPSLQQSLKKEVENLQVDASDLVDESMFQRKDRKVALWVKATTHFIKKML